MLCIVARTCSRGASFGMICRLVIGGGPPARCPAPGVAPGGGGCCANAEDATTRPSTVAGPRLPRRTVGPLSLVHLPERLTRKTPVGGRTTASVDTAAADHGPPD